MERGWKIIINPSNVYDFRQSYLIHSEISNSVKDP